MTKELFSKENKAETGWFKFVKKNDSIQGTLIDIQDQPAKGVFQPQRIYTLKNDSGVWNVGFGVNKKKLHGAMAQAEIGQIVGMRYEDDYQSDDMKTQGLQPAKTIEVYLGEIDLNHQITTDPAVSVDDVPFK